MLITLDGPSGVGKSTLTTLVAAKLQAMSIKVVAASTPTQSTIGQLARNGTYDYRGLTLACLVAADRHLFDSVVVRPALTRGELVVCDRYVLSSLVLDSLDGVDKAFTWNLYASITVPDIAFVVLGDPKDCLERAQKRGQYSRFHSQEVEKSTREMQMFKEVAEQLHQDAPHYPVHVYDIGTKTADEIATDFVRLIIDKRGQTR